MNQGDFVSIDEVSSSADRGAAHLIRNRRPLIDPAAVRRKRDWTVICVLGEREGPDGPEVQVKCANTLVPGPSIAYDKDRRAYVEADGMRHYIAKKSSATTNAADQVAFDCRWEDEFIPVELLSRVQQRSAAAGSRSTSAPLSADADAAVNRTSTLSPTGYNSTERNQRSTSTLSAITFSNLELAHPTSLRFRPTSHMVNYAPGIHDLIERSLGVELATLIGVAPRVVQRRISGAIVRPLQVQEWCIKRKSYLINLLLAQNAEAVLVHMKGEDVLEPCRRCAEDFVTWQGCIVGDDFGEGKRGKMCSFRRDSKYRGSAGDEPTG